MEAQARFCPQESVGQGKTVTINLLSDLTSRAKKDKEAPGEPKKSGKYDERTDLSLKTKKKNDATDLPEDMPDLE